MDAVPELLMVQQAVLYVTDDPEAMLSRSLPTGQNLNVLARRALRR
jgi:hypothetical protein